MSCLDIWLDNALHGIEETAICYHKDGIVQEYRMFQNKDLEVEDEKVKMTGYSILKFLKTYCDKEGGSYWLYKEENSNKVHLYEIPDVKMSEANEVNEENFIIQEYQKEGMYEFKQYDEVFAMAMMYLRLS